MYLQRQWGSGNVYLLVLSRWKINIAENPIVVYGAVDTFGHSYNNHHYRCCGNHCWLIRMLYLLKMKRWNSDLWLVYNNQTQIQWVMILNGWYETLVLNSVYFWTVSLIIARNVIVLDLFSTSASLWWMISQHRIYCTCWGTKGSIICDVVFQSFYSN